MGKREVSREEFYTFLDNYEGRLERDVCGISEPPLVTYNDFTLGNWPESIVASYHNFAGYGRPNTYYLTSATPQSDEAALPRIG